jgi:hypothetical protein
MRRLAIDFRFPEGSPKTGRGLCARPGGRYFLTLTDMVMPAAFFSLPTRVMLLPHL